MGDLAFALVVGVTFGAVVSVPAFVLFKRRELQLVMAAVFAAVGLGALKLVLGHAAEVWN
ncbi:MAG TPA: hypothetical protein VHP37_18695 [Burkholderiales bacterium]|nr:hypothetical protein [Burkholderiales bacterium]